MGLRSTGGLFQLVVVVAYGIMMIIMAHEIGGGGKSYSCTSTNIELDRWMADWTEVDKPRFFHLYARLWSTTTNKMSSRNCDCGALSYNRCCLETYEAVLQPSSYCNVTQQISYRVHHEQYELHEAACPLNIIIIIIIVPKQRSSNWSNCNKYKSIWALNFIYHI